jgi:hypothetical protein
MLKMCPEFVPNWSVIILALALASALALLYNNLITKYQQDLEGYTWLLAAAGVGMTLGLSMFVVPWQYILIIIGFFTASGLPMIGGDILRVIQRKRLAHQELRDEARREAGEVRDAG